jgi:hypothetical protein
MNLRDDSAFEPSGSSLDNFSEEEGILDEVNAEAMERVLAWRATQSVPIQVESQAEDLQRMTCLRCLI